MKKIQTLITYAILLCAIPVFAATSEMTFDEYEIQLASAQQREKDAKEQIAQEQSQIEGLKQQIDDLARQIAAVIADKNTVLGITDQDIANAIAEIAAIRQELDLLLGLSPDELIKRLADIKKIEMQIAALKQKPATFLYRLTNQVAELDQLLARVKANLPDKSSTYTVRLVPGQRDCLYRIAAFDNVYNDPLQWPKIYSANKTIINKAYNRYTKNTSGSKFSRPQDLIFPGQEFEIPR